MQKRVLLFLLDAPVTVEDGEHVHVWVAIQRSAQSTTAQMKTCIKDTV